MVIFSHRGESLDYTENSMSAFYKAYFDGSSGIEMDIRKTLDNKLVLCHDKTINRISESKGKVCDMTYDELLKVDFNGEKIVLLEEVFKFFCNKNIIILAEIKESGFEQDIINLIKKYNLNNIIISSFSSKILKKVRELNENIKIAHLVYYINDKIILNSINDKINILACLSSFIDYDDVVSSHENNILVYAWGLKNYKEISWLKIIDIDGIIVNSYSKAVNYKNN